MRNLRIDQQAGRYRESRSPRLLGQPGDAERPSDANRPLENLRRKVGKAGELAGAAGQHHAAARFGGER